MKNSTFSILTILLILGFMVSGCANTADTQNDTVQDSPSEVAESAQNADSSSDTQSADDPFASLPNPVDASELIFGYSGDDPYSTQRRDNFQEACNELGIQCVVGEVDQLIEQGVDAIIINSDCGTSECGSVVGAHNAILTARDSEIPVFILDTTTITDGAFSISIDHTQWAEISLEWMIEKMGGAGDFIYINPGPANDQTIAIEETLGKYPGINVVDYKIDKYNAHDQLQADVESFIANYPDLKAIWTDVEMMRVVWGLGDLQLEPEDFPLVVCDASKEGLDFWKNNKERNPNFDCIAVVNPPGIAYDAVYAAFYLLNGCQIDTAVLGGMFEKTLPVAIPVVTDENMQEWWATVEGEDIEWNTKLDQRMTPLEIREAWFLD